MSTVDKIFFSKFTEKNVLFPKSFDDHFQSSKIAQSHRKLHTPIMAWAARLQLIGGGAPINKNRRRRRTQIVGGAARRRMAIIQLSFQIDSRRIFVHEVSQTI